MQQLLQHLQGHTPILQCQGPKQRQKTLKKKTKAKPKAASQSPKAMKAMKAMKSMKAKKKDKGTSKETTSKKNKTPVLKRPAGNQQGQKASLRDQTASWRDAATLAAKDDGGPEGEEEENVEQDPEVNPGDGQMVQITTNPESGTRCWAATKRHRS